MRTLASQSSLGALCSARSSQSPRPVAASAWSCRRAQNKCSGAPSRRELSVSWEQKPSVRRATRALSASAETSNEEQVTIDNCTVLVVGDNTLGLEVMRCFAKAGSWVTAFHEGELHRKEIEGLGAMLAVGDATSADKIAKALRGNTFDAVIYAVGDDASDAIASQNGQLNAIMAARGAKVPRFLLVSSAGAEDEETLGLVQRNLEEGGALQWTIVRTGPLSNSSSGPLKVSEDLQATATSVSAADVAYLVSQVLFDDDFSNKVLVALASEQQ